VTSSALEFIRGESVAEVAAKVAEARAGQRVPLVGDSRWTDEYWQAVCDTWRAMPLPEGAAWAALSSGTTGNPRLILRSEESWSDSFEVLNKLLQASASDVFYIPGSPASSLALFTFAHAAALRAKVVGEDQLASATIFHGTPSLFRSTLAKLSNTESPKLRVALIGGDSLDDHTRALAAKHSIRVISYYGAAELSFVAVDVDGGGFKPFDGVGLKIIDNQLWIKSPYLALGYLGAGGSLKATPEGWATVGDLASFENGYLKIHGRADGAIQTAAVTVVPEDVEQALQNLEAVKQVVVFGLPNESIGNLVAAVLVFDTKFDADLRSLMAVEAQAAKLLSPTHRPRVWFVAESVPVTISSKPARKLIQAAAIAGEYRKLV
jgi:acyl-coenzyme A synthetase/AMP-(fatty) acid ligase